MPLEHSASNAARDRNIHTLMGEIGKSPHVSSPAQAIAIGYATQRRAGRAIGGVAPNVGFGNPVMGAPSGVTSPGITPPMGAPSGIQPAMMPPTQVPQGMPAGLGGSFPFMARLGGMAPAGIPMGMPGMGSMGAPSNVLPAGVSAPAQFGQNPAQFGQGLMGRPMMNTGGALHRDMGGFNMARSPHLAPSWQTKQEARGMMHGPILSAVPGRTDNHLTRVPSGSYVLPASHISSMGQSNSVAGLAAAHAMFGPSGPYGAKALRMGHGPGAPRPPHMAKFADGGYSEGGARGGEDHEPVDVALSGGEYVIHPSVVRAIGKGSLKNGHRILDSYVMNARKRDIEALKNLPPPAKK